MGAQLIAAVAGAARVAEIGELADRLEALERALNAQGVEVKKHMPDRNYAA
ncbi:hypothetical protein [Plasticicumulans sp.]|uniref:hypothetical protein n=1 Tax=Plasticicumulans sp. TaxID=2307179 RepID=UPI00393DD97C